MEAAEALPSPRRPANDDVVSVFVASSRRPGREPPRSAHGLSRPDPLCLGRDGTTGGLADAWVAEPRLAGGRPLMGGTQSFTVLSERGRSLPVWWAAAAVHIAKTVNTEEFKFKFKGRRAVQKTTAKHNQTSGPR